MLLPSLSIFANATWSAWSSKHINMLGRVCVLFRCFLSMKSPKIWNQIGETGKEWVAMGTNFFKAAGVLPVELLLCQVSMVCAKSWRRLVYLYSWCYIGLNKWPQQSCHLHISCTFQTISRINPDILKLQTAFLIFSGILCDKYEFDHSSTWRINEKKSLIIRINLL